MILDYFDAKHRRQSQVATIALSSGEQLKVKLHEILSAGYSWEIEEQPQGLELEGRDSYPENPDRTREFVGGADIVEFTFSAAEVQGQLLLEYSRPWESMPALYQIQIQIN